LKNTVFLKKSVFLQVLGDKAKLIRRRLRRLLQDVLIGLDECQTEGRDLCAAAVRASSGTDDDRLVKTMIHQINKLPCPAIRHAHLLGSGRNGTVLHNVLQQLDFAWTERDVALMADPDFKQ
jgi:hypothetical protein